MRFKPEPASSHAAVPTTDRCAWCVNEDPASAELAVTTVAGTSCCASHVNRSLKLLTAASVHRG